MRVAARAAASTASRVVCLRRQSVLSLSSAVWTTSQQRAAASSSSRRVLNHHRRQRSIVRTMASTSTKDTGGDGAVPAPPSYVVTVHAADEATLSTARSLLGSTKELSAGGGATAAVEFSDGKTSSRSATPSSSSSTFDPAPYFAALRTRSLGRCLLLSPLLPSTQDLVQKASSGAEAAARGGDGRRLPDGAVCVADAQAAGRGRGANAWASPPGCLMFSLSADVRLPGTRLPFVQYLVSLALVRAARREVEEVAGSGGGGEGAAVAGETATGTATATATAAAAADSIRIKWPNDLYAGGKKLAGVLCHSSYVSSPKPAASTTGGASGSDTNSSCFRLTAGVGINVTNEPPPGAASLAGLLNLPPQTTEEGGGGARRRPPSREALLASALNELEPMLAALCSPSVGFSEELRADYERAWLHSGQVVEVEEGADMVATSNSSGSGAAAGGGSGAAASSSAARRRRVKITGLSPSGFLAAVDADGDGVTRYELHPDGNSLDFFEGLVRRKAGPPPPR